MISSHSSLKKMAKLQDYFYLLGLFCLPVTAFFLPISVTGTKIGISTAAICSVLSGQFFKKFEYIIKNPVSISILFIFIFAALSMFWGIASWDERLSGLHKYDKLLYFIFLIPLCLEEKWRDSAINAFLIAMALTVSISFLKQYMGWSFGNIPKDATWIFHSHIETSYFVAFSAYIFIYRIFFTRLSTRMVVFYVILFLFFTWQEFFINDGRTGWSVYFALMILFFGQLNLKRVLEKRDLPKDKWRLAWAFAKGILFGILSAIILGLILYTFSSLVKNTINHSLHNYVFSNAHLGDTSDSLNQVGRKQSIDYRLDFFKMSWVMAKEHPVLGVGPSGFKAFFYEMGGIPGWGTKLDHPHNEYLLTLVNFGVIGLVLLLYFFYVQWRLSFAYIHGWPIGQALVLSFMLGCCYNALLYTTVTGHFYVFFLALLFCRASRKL